MQPSRGARATRADSIRGDVLGSGGLSSVSRDSIRGEVLVCRRCGLVFMATVQEQRCPACEKDSVIQELRAELMRTQQQYDMLATEYQKTRVHVDLVMAMRDAMTLTDQADITFLKQVLYRWRDDRGVTIRVTHAPPKVTSKGAPVKGAQTLPNGFLALYRGNDDVEECKFSSPGGVALAGYFDEALRTHGHPHAMDTLLRAMNQHLSELSEERL